MKKVLTYIVLIIFMVMIYQKRNDIYKTYMRLFNNESYAISNLEKNKYFRNHDYKFVQNTDTFIPKDKQDILNIYYTIVNSGMNEFTFHCDDNYINCLDDITELTNNQTMISNINNFVHPYNSFSSIETTIDSRDNVSLRINHVYNNDMIVLLNYKVDEIYNDLYKDNISIKENIKSFHDYIINKTRYDKERADSKIVKYKSDNAYGVLIEGIGLCGGYTDAMSLFLEKMNIDNYKISTINHTWNKVLVDNKWLHLDLTWDDPISEDGTDILDDKFFLISTTELLEIEKTEHNYDINIFEN